MAKKNGGNYRTGGGYKVGRGYQIDQPFDIWNDRMGKLYTPTTEQIDFERNLNIWDMGDFGFGPGIPYPKAVSVDDEVK